MNGDEQAPPLIIDILTEAEEPESQAVPESSKYTLLYHNGKELCKEAEEHDVMESDKCGPRCCLLGFVSKRPERQFGRGQTQVNTVPDSEPGPCSTLLPVGFKRK